MEFTQHRCKNCGGSLQPFGEGKLKCPHCGSVFDVQSAEQHTKKMQQLFDDAKQEIINNLRRNLYNAINTEYISSNEIHDICASLKQYLPDDFQANFYDIAAGSNVRQLTQAIRRIDVEKNYDDVDGVVQYLIRSLQNEFLLELNNLVERAYKLRDLAKYEQYATEISKEAEKVQMGVYETKLPREVFVAYSSKDMSYVSELVEVLESQSMKCFVAARNLRHGRGAVENYNRALEEAMDHCKSFVFVSSRNSRSIDCDALKIEIPFIQQKDIANAPAEYRNNYATIPHRYKKPRVEYRIEESIGMSAADSITNEFFEGYERVYSPREVAQRIMKQLLHTNEPTPPPQKATQTTTEKKKVCVACGHENPVDAKFCSACGKTQFVGSVAELLRLNEEKQKAAQLEAQRQIREAKEEAARQEAAQREAQRRMREAQEDARRQREAAQRAKEQSFSSYQSNNTSSYQNNSYKTSTSPSYSTSTSSSAKSPKNRRTAFWLCLFLGTVGAHRFYVGKNGSGFIYLLTRGGLLIGCLVDLISILRGTFTDSNNLPLKKEPKPGKNPYQPQKKKRSAKPIIILLLLVLIGVGIFFGVTAFNNDSKVTSVERLISLLPEDSEQYLDYHQDIVDAYAAYQELDPKLQAKVENADKLFACMEGLEIEEAYEMQQNLQFTEANGGYAVSVKSDRANSLSGKLEIPSTYRGQPVTTIPENGFAGCSRITSLIVPNSVTNIGYAAFSGCSNISSVTLPFVGTSKTASGKEGVLGYIFGTTEYTGGTATQQYYDLGNYDRNTYYIPGQLKAVTVTDATQLSYGAFYNCSMLREINLNEDIISAGVHCFYYCSNITQINLPNITTISAAMLEGCTSLTSFNINDSVTSIGNYAFKNCMALSRINSDVEGEFIISNNIQSIGFEAFNGCIKLQSITLPFVGASKTASGKEGVFGYIFGENTYTGGTATQQYYNSGNYDQKTYYIPGQLNAVTITDATRISYGAFYNCSTITTLSINDSAKYNVAEKAFFNCIIPTYY